MNDKLNQDQLDNKNDIHNSESDVKPEVVSNDNDSSSNDQPLDKIPSVLGANQEILKQMQTRQREMSKTKAMWVRVALLLFVFPIPWIIAIILLIVDKTTSSSIPVYAQIIPWVFPLLPVIGFVIYATIRISRVKKTMSSLGFDREKFLEESIAQEEKRRASFAPNEVADQNSSANQSVSSNEALIKNLKTMKASKKEVDEINAKIKTRATNVINDIASEVTPPPSNHNNSTTKVSEAIKNNDAKSLKSNVEVNSAPSNVEVNSAPSNVEVNSAPSNVDINNQKDMKNSNLSNNSADKEVDFDLSATIEEQLVNESNINAK